MSNLKKIEVANSNFHLSINHANRWVICALAEEMWIFSINFSNKTHWLISCFFLKKITFGCMTQLIDISNVSSYSLFTGSPVYLNYSFGWVNVKDVALAHVLACEVPSASGRYCMVDRVIHFSEIVKIIHEMYPSLPVPDK